jgi:hypothetical protein
MEPQAGLDRQADQIVALSSAALVMSAMQRPADWSDDRKKDPAEAGRFWGD